ncbi:MAG: GNAT family N-acetyltransferase [Verrucomicrobia bacterium]|nr:GNAT family N-acetyltransferase [Verrucomicrobiota bacterium]
MKVEPDSWLTQVFGYAVFKVSFTTENTEWSADSPASQWFGGKAPEESAFLYAKIPTHRVDQLRILARAGFAVVDVNVTLGRRPSPQPSGKAENRIALRESTASDRETLLKIASSCFKYSRFHLDPEIPGDLANAVKRAWVESYCHKTRGEKLVVAEWDGQLAGFVALLNHDSDSGRERVIDLVGVEEAYQRKGVGSRLIDYVVNDSAGRAVWVKVGTQVANTPSVRLYEKAGFCLTASAYVLHAHIRGGQLRR